MSKHPVAIRLRECQGLVAALQDILDTALALAHYHNLEQNYIHAIKKALAQNTLASAHIANTATLLEQAAPPEPTP